MNIPRATRRYEHASSHLRNLSTGAAVFLASLACGGGGGGTPTSPGGPPAPTATPAATEIAGTWTGTATSLADSGTCFAQATATGTVPARWLFAVADGNLQASQTLNNAITCEFTASESGGRVTLRADLARSRPECGVQEVPCASGAQSIRLELDVDRSTFGGEVSRTRMELSGTAIWRAYEVGSGRRLEDYVAPGVQSLTKN